MLRRLPLVLSVLAACSAPARVPSAPAASPTDAGPQLLAAAVLDAFAAADTIAFDSLFPFDRGRGMVRFAASRGIRPVPGIARVVARRGDSATIALGGHIEFGNSGDETGYAEAFSGIYDATRDDGGWRLTQRFVLDSLARIRSQDLDVTLEPGRGLRVRDSLAVDVRGHAGFATRLNHAATIESVVLNGDPAEYDFGGGLLWVRAPSGASSVVVDYALDVAHDSTHEANSARFAADYGHVRNQYYWHPRGTGWSRFTVRVRAPARVHVATDLPQRDTVIGGERFVDARSRGATFAISLVYDAAWQPLQRRVGDVTLALFTAPDFAPPVDTLVAAFERTYAVLTDHFGPPASSYFSIAQQRAREGGGWLWRSNEMIGAAAQGSRVTWPGPPPRASFGHEVAHGWLSATGAGSNFLGEGWAMLAESILIADEFGAEAERRFWAHRANLYWLQGNEGRMRIVEDPGNAGIAYTKGPWILRMLRGWIGEEAFAQGLRAFMRIVPGEAAGVEEFSAAMSDAAGRDVWPFLRPWLEEAVLPDVVARVEPVGVVVEQRGPLFVLPLELDLVTSDGRAIRRTILLDTRADTVSVAGLAPIRDVIVDPENRLLLRRHRGEVVPFELAASAVPGASEVLLVPDFSREPLAATRQGDAWVVTVPLAAGIYLYDWRVDGVDRAGGVREVRPAQPLEDAFPR